MQQGHIKLTTIDLFKDGKVEGVYKAHDMATYNACRVATYMSHLTAHANRERGKETQNRDVFFLQTSVFFFFTDISFLYLI